jgi:hypothetical protein
MKIIYNKWIPFKGFSAINLFGVIFARHGVHLSVTTIQHERIHTEQIKELGYVPFYIWYLLEWVVKLLWYGKRSYYNISFEREARAGQEELFYMRNRKRYSFLKYL